LNQTSSGSLRASDKELDFVLWGATGLVGQLVARLMARRGSKLTWGLAARDAETLRALHTAIGAPEDVPLMVADALDGASLEAMAARARMVISVVGPYQHHGTELARICAMGGIAYIDVSGEPLWARRVIDSLEDRARSSGACMVMSCGFDSLPFELAVYLLQSAAFEAEGRPLPHVSSRVLFSNVGGFSVGTLNSLLGTADEVRADPEAAALHEDPYLLTGGFHGPQGPAPTEPCYDDMLGMWAAPWVMSPINTANLHRSNRLQNHAWGEDFTYDEMLLAGPGEEGRHMAEAITRDMVALVAPGADSLGTQEGPALDAVDPVYTVTAYGRTSRGRDLFATVSGDGNPGYAAAAAIALEVAHCLLEDLTPAAPAGIWTPGALAAELLIARLRQSGVMRFEIEADTI
jgi:short subunit dehydrogenase-like uncharacterized protein